MKKQIKYLILALAIIIVLGAGFFALTLIPANQTGNSSTEDLTVVLLDKKTSDIQQIRIINSTGDYAVALNDDNIFEVAELAEYPRNATFYATFVTTLSSITADRMIVENAEDLATYGLDDPITSATITLKDGEKISFHVGDAAPSSAGYYLQVNDSNNVYLLNANTASFLATDRLAFIDTTLTNPLDQSEGWDFHRVEFGGTVRETPIIVVPNDPVPDGEVQLFAHIITSPERSNYDVEEGAELLQAIFGVSAQIAVEAGPDEETLAEYGFDNPYSTLYVEINNDKFTLTIGKKDDAYYYIMRDDVDVIYRVAHSSIVWAETQYEDVLSPLFFTPFIDKVSSIDITNGELSYSYDIEGTNDDMAASYNGTELDLDNFKKFYQTLIAVHLEEKAEGEEPTGEHLMTITYNYKEGGSDTLDFYLCAKNPRQALICMNGRNMGYSVRTAKLDKILEDCVRVIEGTDIATQW